jgi:hypothetical protein
VRCSPDDDGDDGDGDDDEVGESIGECDRLVELISNGGTDPW